MKFFIAAITLVILSLANLSHACIKAHGQYAMRTYKAWDWEIYDNRILQCTLQEAKLNNAPANGDGRETPMNCIEDNVQAWLWDDDYGKIVVRYNRYNKDGTSQNEVRMWTADGTASLGKGFEEIELYGYAHCTEEGDRPDLWIGASEVGL